MGYVIGWLTSGRRARAAVSALGPEPLDHAPVRSAGLLHFTGITPALSPSCREPVTRALSTPAALRAHAVSFDVNHRPALWPDGTAATVLRRLADRADIVFVGLDEAQGLWGTDLTVTGLWRLLPHPRILVVKDGVRAATAFTGDGVHTVPALRTTVMEPVGAGDAFAAGFLAGLLRGAAPAQALRPGHITAVPALQVAQDHGPLPDAQQIGGLLALPATEWEARSSADRRRHRSS